MRGVSESDEGEDRAEVLGEMLAGLMAVAMGEECDCKTCRRLRNMDVLLRGEELPD